MAIGSAEVRARTLFTQQRLSARAFGAVIAQDPVLSCRQPPPPFRIAVDNRKALGIGSAAAASGQDWKCGSGSEPAEEATAGDLRFSHCTGLLQVVGT